MNGKLDTKATNTFIHSLRLNGYNQLSKQASLPSSAKTIKLNQKAMSNYQKRISRIFLDIKLYYSKQKASKNKMKHIFLVHYLIIILEVIIFSCCCFGFFPDRVSLCIPLAVLELTM